MSSIARSRVGLVFLAAALPLAYLGCGTAEEQPSQPEAPASSAPASPKTSALPVTLASGETVEANVGRLAATAAPPPVMLGRAFDVEEHRGGNSRVVLMGHEFWESNMASSADVVGKTIEFGGQPRTIVGVLGPDSELDSVVDLWLPAQSE